MSITTASTDDSFSSRGQTPVAIAIQGGGSHSAFGAGVLMGLLSRWDDAYEVVGISGTSGGALNAIATWYGLVTADESRAVELLDDLWKDLSASDLGDRFVNGLLVGVHRIECFGLPWPKISPYQNPGSRLGKKRIIDTLERHIDFDAIPRLCRRVVPELVVGTVDINAGEFETFTNEMVTPKAVLASAAIPTIYEAVEIDGHLHWDGMFSQNPPINDLMTVPPERKPRELWVIQINPQESAGEPRTMEEIADRRNELWGNISLNQELRTVERVNKWIDAGYLPESDFTKTRVRRITMDKSYPSASKVDRTPSFIRELIDHGRRRAAEFRM